MYYSTFYKQRKSLRIIIKKVEKLKDQIEDTNIKELMENARVDLSNALNIANATRKKRVHSMTKDRVLKLIIAGVTIRKISLQCAVSGKYVEQLMRANKITRYQPRKLKCL